MQLPSSLQNLIEVLRELPSIGPRQATRLAFHLIEQGPETIERLARTFDKVAEIRLCDNCNFIHTNSSGLCDICSDKNRNDHTIMVVEKETDLLSLENTGTYHGKYFILGAIPKAGLINAEQKERLLKLKNHIAGKSGGKIQEIILAFNLTSVGDFHANIISKELQGLADKISRLGRGLPTGGEIEFADDETLGSAIQNRNQTK